MLGGWLEAKTHGSIWKLFSKVSRGMDNINENQSATRGLVSLQLGMVFNQFQGFVGWVDPAMIFSVNPMLNPPTQTKSNLVGPR
jgi:hypothetical protein